MVTDLENITTAIDYEVIYGLSNAVFEFDLESF